MGLIYAYRRLEAEEFINSVKGGVVYALYFIGSTKTSTIPGISVAGASPEMTLYTPAIDVEYLFHGKPVSIDVIPTTPEGIPTPAVLTRASLKAAKIPFMVVDTGSYLRPQIPHITLPSRTVGESIDTGKALPYHVVEKLYRDARSLAKVLPGHADLVVLGESIPGGTTTALGTLVALGYDAWGKVSSAGPKNPHDLKRRVVEKGLKLESLPTRDPIRAAASLGDPVHISMAGFLAGAIDRGLKVILAGGTQMAAVLALAKHSGVELSSRNIIIGTTRWLINDPYSDLIGLVRMIEPSVPVVAYNFNFADAPYQGLRLYEEGYVKEGVGAGGTAVAAHAVKGVAASVITEGIYREYALLVG